MCTIKLQVHITMHKRAASANIPECAGTSSSHVLTALTHKIDEIANSYVDVSL